MSNLSESLARNDFTLTAELNPPKGTDLRDLFDAGEALRHLVTAFNLTDSAASRMAMAPMAVAHLLGDRGIESTLQIAGRDRNRLAIQGGYAGRARAGRRQHRLHDRRPAFRR